MRHALEESVAEYIARHDLLGTGESVVVGVSGGVDSMVCLAVLWRLGYDVHALHVNYGLRDGAEADEVLVRRWCREQTPPVPLCVETCDPQARAADRNESLQEAARIQRYKVLSAVAQDVGAPVVAVGHHRDDQAETLLLNLLRGAGPEGLAGMPPVRACEHAPSIRLIRPLLGCRRNEIKAFAREVRLPWREDPSNRDPSYDRAVIRTEVMPLLQERFGNTTDALARAASLNREYVDHTLRPALRRRMDWCYKERTRGATLSLEGLEREPSVWRRRLILEALDRVLPSAPKSAAVAVEVEGLIDAQVGRRVEVGEGAVWREREVLRFVSEREPSSSAEFPISVTRGEEVSVPQGTLLVDLLEESPSSLDSGTPNVEYADADRLEDPLTLRTWREGDRLQPLGLEGSKLVSDLLTDAKEPPHRRAEVCVLCSAGQPVWVVGHRLDRRIRVRTSTEQVVRLSWCPREKASDDCNST
jgi:tRNA(Ile)-lysidine synthase